MRKREMARAVLFAGILVGLAGRERAHASPPANDNFADASAIPTIPFTDSGELGGTTTEPGEPQICSFVSQSVWYVFTPSSTVVFRAQASGPGVNLNVFRSFGGGIGGLGFMGCSGGGSMTVTANAGITYYLQVGTGFGGGAQVTLDLALLPPPAHDAFADAIDVGGLPFDDSFDFTAATVEPGEPGPGGSSGAASVWYTYTATGPEALSAGSSFCCASSFLAVYAGDSLSDLSEVASGFGQLTTFHPTPGTTYHIQVGRQASFGGAIQASFHLDRTPPPTVNFNGYPFDPSTYDLVQFNDYSYDPGQVGIASQVWDFGDGATATGCCPSHRYAADADYTVGLTVTTHDGRTASASHPLAVRTHDVAITRFSVPSSASANQTRALSVGVNNTRYPDTVQVQLFKSVPGSYNSFQLVGTLTQLAPVVSRNREIPFDFSYTFTSEDAAVGKVTFQAVATVFGARDAHAADNTAIAAPTRVRP
jgi:PKD domain-containing protein